MDLANAALNARAFGQIAAAVSPWVPTSGPSRSSDVTAQWLTEHLGKLVGARALSVCALDDTTGTTDRRRLVVEGDTAGKRSGFRRTRSSLNVDGGSNVFA